RLVFMQRSVLLALHAGRTRQRRLGHRHFAYRLPLRALGAMNTGMRGNHRDTETPRTKKRARVDEPCALVRMIPLMRTEGRPQAPRPAHSLDFFLYSSSISVPLRLCGSP